MQIIRTVAELRAALEGKGRPVLVPTMGNLHAGHLSLVRIARERGGLVVASIFVNRLQFAPHEDFATYPRTFERDCELLAGCGCDVVFAPADAEIYPEAQGYMVHPPHGLADILEGQVRPGVFPGVCTVVLQLVNMVEPAVAAFGKAIYQQRLVVRGIVPHGTLPRHSIAAHIVLDP